jgi:hypothetical protein
MPVGALAVYQLGRATVAWGYGRAGEFGTRDIEFESDQR